MIDLTPIPRPESRPDGPWEGYLVTSPLQAHLLNPKGQIGFVVLFEGSYAALNNDAKPVSGPHDTPRKAAESLFCKAA